MRDQDHRPAAHHAGQVIENALLGHGVDARKGIVENQDSRIAQNGAGDGGALLLPAGQA